MMSNSIDFSSPWYYRWITQRGQKGKETSLAERTWNFYCRTCRLMVTKEVRIYSIDLLEVVHIFKKDLNRVHPSVQITFSFGKNKNTYDSFDDFGWFTTTSLNYLAEIGQHLSCLILNIIPDDLTRRGMQRYTAGNEQKRRCSDRLWIGLVEEESKKISWKQFSVGNVQERTPMAAGAADYVTISVNNWCNYEILHWKEYVHEVETTENDMCRWKFVASLGAGKDLRSWMLDERSISTRHASPVTVSSLLQLMLHVISLTKLELH